MPPPISPGNPSVLDERTPIGDSRHDRNVQDSRSHGGCLERVKNCLALKSTLVLCLIIITLTFVSGMALLGADLHWGGLGLVCVALLVFVALCLLPLKRKGAVTPQPRNSAGGVSVRLRSEPLPVSMCAHLHMRSANMNVVPYPLEEVTIVDISKMYPPPFAPPPYQEKVPDSYRKAQQLLIGP
ncbi:uncharacterized protein LOC8028834 [Ixodes scapularis]|uniref:uncharacterized protein LOC8028834 n=1 Tax=Ixodes scapularis TaxID=6945 RepID=UPI001AA00BEF|nr:uncharacterized protein LOC8028834 [Ixodes scapularis]